MADEILTAVEVAQFRKVTEKAVYTMAHKRWSQSKRIAKPHQRGCGPWTCESVRSSVYAGLVAANEGKLWLDA